MRKETRERIILYLLFVAGIIAGQILLKIFLF